MTLLDSQNNNFLIHKYLTMISHYYYQDKLLQHCVHDEGQSQWHRNKCHSNKMMNE